MIALAPWQALLDGLGWLVARIYDVIPNYGVTIMVLTVVIRLVLLPLGIKQIRSMQSMQAIQPKVKAIQQKHKQNKQRQQEEIMKLYREHGVNPFSGCWPVLLQFPILIAMYSILRWPQHPVHVPVESALYSEAILPQIPPVSSLEEVPSEPGPSAGTAFLGMNLLCSATQAGNPRAQLADTASVEADGEEQKVVYPVSCGQGAASRVPYYAFAFLMFATTHYQMRQMQKASPPGAASQQQQAILKVMPIMFGVFGIFFPSGLVLYWSTSNVWQIGQQYFMLKNRPTAETLAAKADGKKDKRGFMERMMEQAGGERQRREEHSGGKPGKPGGKPGKPGQKPRKKKPGSGGSGGGDRDQRPKR